jgi:DnaK suppressor protein
MQPAEFQEFKQILDTLLENVRRPLGHREEIAIENTPDTLDQVQHATDREMAIRQLEFDSSRLRSLKSALERIEDGTYGTCLRCDSEIGMKRLKAVPWTSHCLECQEAADQEKKQAAEEEIAPAPHLHTRVA